MFNVKNASTIYILIILMCPPPPVRTSSWHQEENVLLHNVSTTWPLQHGALKGRMHLPKALTALGPGSCSDAEGHLGIF